MFYCPVHPTTIALLLCAMSLSPSLVIPSDISNPVSLVQRHIGGDRPCVSTRILESLAVRLSNAPPLMASTITRVIMGPSVVGVSEAAATSAVSRRSLYRWCARIGLSTPHTLVAVGKMLRAYACLRYDNRSVGEAASLAGFNSYKTFVRHCASVTNASPSGLRKMSEEDFFKRIQDELSLTTAAPNR